MNGGWFTRTACFLISLWFTLQGLGARAAFPQDPDSLRHAVMVMPDNSAKADHLVALAKYYYYIDKDSSMAYVRQAYNLSIRLNYTIGMVDGLFLESKIYREKAEFLQSRESILKAIELAVPLQDSLRLGKVYFQLSSVSLDLSDYAEALEANRNSLSYYQPLKDTLGIVANYNSIGMVFQRSSRFDSAAVFFLKSVRLCELKKDEVSLAVVFDNLGQVFLADSLYEDAEKYFLKSLELNRKLNRPKWIADNMINMGRLASAKSDYEQAIGWYDQAAQIIAEMDDGVAMVDLYNNYGVVYYRMKDYARAIRYFDRAIEGYLEGDYVRGYICAMGNKASVLADQGNYREALALTDSCLALSSREGIIEFRLTYLNNMADTYSRTGDFKHAYEYQARYYALEDSLYTVEKTKAISELKMKYEKEKDQARILLLEKENLKRTSQRNTTIFLSSGFALLVLFIMLFLRQKAVKDRIIAEQKVLQLEEEKRLLAAKYVLEGQEEERKRIARELHDGLGVLLSTTKMHFTSITDTNPENRLLIEKAKELLEQATGDVRKISHSMMPGLLTKLGFFEAVEDLFENLNDTEDLTAECIINGEADRMQENREIMLYRVIQEIVNNSLKHSHAGRLRLVFDILPDRLDIVYTDDGQGFDVNKVMAGEAESMGLRSIQARIDFLGGKLDLESSQGSGVRYRITIPK